VLEHIIAKRYARTIAPPALVLVLSVLGAAAPPPASGGEGTGRPASPSALDRAKTLARCERREGRVRALAWLAKLARPGTTAGDEATYRYAELCLRFHSEGEPGALPRARKAFERLARSAGSRWGLRGRVGAWRVQALEGKRAEAVKNLDRFLGRNTKCERAVEAAFHLGCIHAGKKDDLAELKRARRALKHALALHAAVKKYHPPLVEAREIRAKLARVEKRIRELEAGRLKTLFARAEKLRRAKKFDAAVRLYAEIRRDFPGRDLAELSAVRIAECHLGRGELKKALETARDFVAANPLGAYRGHAHVLIGDVHLERLFDVTGAEPEFRCVLEPAKQSRRPKWVALRRQRMIAYRQVDPRNTPPDARAHASWKQVLHHAHERAGIFEYLRRNYKKAAEHFDASQRLKPNRTYGNHPHQGMSELADRIRRKVEIIPPSMLAERAGRPKLVLLLASLYMEGWRDQRALDLLRRVAGGEFKEASLNQRAYAQVKIAEGLFYNRKDAEAIKVLRKFEAKPYNATAFAARALLQLAVVVNRKHGLAEGLKYLDKCYRRDPGSEWGRMALYQKAFAMYATDRTEEALRLFKEYAARYPHSFPVRQGHVKSFVKELRADLAEKKRKKKKRKGAKKQ
jgi:outer membrane protein assembly factor BamD (BamD/ComL family)